MYTTFYGSVHDLDLAFQTWAIRLKTLMLSWKCLRKELVSSYIPLTRNRTFTFLGFALVVPSLSYILKLALDKRDLPLLQDIPRDLFVGYFGGIKLVYRDMGEVPLTSS